MRKVKLRLTKTDLLDTQTLPFLICSSTKKKTKIKKKSKNKSANLHWVVCHHVSWLRSVARPCCLVAGSLLFSADVLLWSACATSVFSPCGSHPPRRCCNVDATFPSVWLTRSFPRWFKGEQALTGRPRFDHAPPCPNMVIMALTGVNCECVVTRYNNITLLL